MSFSFMAPKMSGDNPPINNFEKEKAIDVYSFGLHVYFVYKDPLPDDDLSNSFNILLECCNKTHSLNSPIQYSK